MGEDKNIEVKKLEVKVGGVEVRIEKGEMYISAASVNVEEDKARKDREKKLADMQIGASAALVLVVFAAQFAPITHNTSLAITLSIIGVVMMIVLWKRWRAI